MGFCRSGHLALFGADPGNDRMTLRLLESLYFVARCAVYEYSSYIHHCGRLGPVVFGCLACLWWWVVLTPAQRLHPINNGPR